MFLSPIPENLCVMREFSFECKLQKNQVINTAMCRKFNGVLPGHYWYLQMFPSNIVDPVHFRPSEVKVLLYTNKCPTEGMLCRFSFSLKQGDREMHRRSGYFLFSKTKPRSEAYGIPLHDVYDNEEFQICVKGHAEVNYKFNKLPHHKCERQMFYTQNMQNLQSLFESGDYSDAVIIVDGKEIKCHKCILACRSSYFSAMFQSGLSESISNQIEITDFDYETIKTMINFLYCFNFDTPKIYKKSPQKFGLNLLRAADKYQINDLKNICEVHVASMIDATNALDILLHADMYSAQRVKKEAMDFICQNSDFFKQAEQYEPLINKPNLLRDLLLNKFDKGDAS